MVKEDLNLIKISNVKKILFGCNAIKNLEIVIKSLGVSRGKNEIIFFVDNFFEDKLDILGIDNFSNEILFIVNTKKEPTTDDVDKFVERIKFNGIPELIVGIGGGSTLDISKAVSNMLTNLGKSEDYQGWDKLKVPGVYKIGIPTISGTGAESSKTCVLINKKKGIKLGMNSQFSVFDELILDPNLSRTVEKNQYFYTGMDAFIHCFESLNGFYRNSLADAFSREVLKFCDEIFLSDEMMSDYNREKLMLASYLGGSAIGMSYVGLVHPFSAGLSTVLELHHCVANCIVMRAMEEFYPIEFNKFWSYVDKHNIYIPENICKNLGEDDLIRLFNATIIHEKPLMNALGQNFRNILTFEKVIEIFLKM